MSKLIAEQVKFDNAMIPVSLNGAATTRYFGMNGYGKVCFVVELGAMAAAVTSALAIVEAQNAAGGGSQAIATLADTITANTAVTSALLTSALVHVAGDTYTVNGLVFTAAAADGGATSRTYAVGADATASTANLAAKINSAVVGVPGVTASANVGALTLTSSDPGAVTITLAASAGAVGVPSTLSSQGYIEVDASAMDLADGFDHIGLTVTNSAACLTSVLCLRGNARYTPVQAVAAEDF
ncbi:MAG: hypothetical protein PHT02_07095 [Tissierellia bacterium]|nr:hypothetical protein [Tissierellia bacterium]